MARLARLDVPGCVHHVMQRGLDQRAIFQDAAEFARMLQDLGMLMRQFQVALHAYVLMPDHFHLLATPAQPGALSRAMQALGRRYVRWFNARHGRSGTLWDGRFRSTVIEPQTHLIDCMRYIELNPVRNALVQDPATYPWSSYQHHLGARTDPLLTDHPQFWALGNTPFERQAAYGRACAVPLEGRVRDAIRSATLGGWPLGSAEFIDALAQRTARRLARRAPGRPRRAATEHAAGVR